MQKPIRNIAIGATTLVLLLFAFVGMRGMLNPIAASPRYGMPVSDDAGALFFRVYLSRNFVILIAATIFLVRQKWNSLATLMTVCILLPLFDATILVFQLGSRAPLTFHLVTATVLTLLSGLLWLHAKKAKPDEGSQSASAG